MIRFGLDLVILIRVGNQIEACCSHLLSIAFIIFSAKRLPLFEIAHTLWGAYQRCVCLYSVTPQAVYAPHRSSYVEHNIN